MTGLDAKCFDFIKIFIILSTKGQQKIVNCLKFYKFTESAILAEKLFHLNF